MILITVEYFHFTLSSTIHISLHFISNADTLEGINTYKDRCIHIVAAVKKFREKLSIETVYSTISLLKTKNAL